MQDDQGEHLTPSGECLRVIYALLGVNQSWLVRASGGQLRQTTISMIEHEGQRVRPFFQTIDIICRTFESHPKWGEVLQRYPTIRMNLYHVNGWSTPEERSAAEGYYRAMFTSIVRRSRRRKGRPSRQGPDERPPRAPGRRNRPAT